MLLWDISLAKESKEIQPVHSEGDQPWDFFGRNDAKAETPVLWPPHVKSSFIGKDSDAGRDWGQEEKGTPEDEMAGWHHWLNGCESEWTLGVGDGQGGLACCDSWGRKESDTTERLIWSDLKESWGLWDLWVCLHIPTARFSEESHVFHYGLISISFPPLLDSRSRFSFYSFPVVRVERELFVTLFFFFFKARQTSTSSVVQLSLWFKIYNKYLEGKKSYRKFNMLRWTHESNFISFRKPPDNTMKWFFFKGINS